MNYLSLDYLNFLTMHEMACVHHILEREMAQILDHFTLYSLKWQVPTQQAIDDRLVLVMDGPGGHVMVRWDARKVMRRIGVSWFYPTYAPKSMFTGALFKREALALLPSDIGSSYSMLTNPAICHPNEYRLYYENRWDMLRVSVAADNWRRSRAWKTAA